jgi:hypothetical protein
LEEKYAPEFSIGPMGGAQKSPKRPKFGPKLPKRSSKPNSSPNYTRNMALRDLNTLKYTNICILSKVGADANSINSILTLGGPQKYPEKPQSLRTQCPV